AHQGRGRPRQPPPCRHGTRAGVQAADLTVPDRPSPHVMALRRLPRPPRLGLRPRITLAFAASGLLLSALLAGSTWAITRESLLTQREASATRQTYQNARYMQRQIPEDRDAASVRVAMNGLVTT